jgi:hypothetical protein
MEEASQDFTPTVALADNVAPLQLGASYLLQWIAAICFISVIAGGAFAQIQVLLLQGNVPVTPAIFKAILLLVLGVAFFARGGRCVISLQLMLGILLVLGLTVSTVHILFSSSLPLNDLLLSDFLMYFLLFLGCAVSAVPIMVSPKLLTWLLLLVFVVSLSIGAAQHFLNDKVVATDSVDGKFAVQAWNFYGQVRAFGLFPSPMDFGFFCALIGNFGVVLAVRERHRFVGWSMVILAGFGCFLTLTRAAQICYCVGLPVAYVLSNGKPKILVRVLPICTLLTAVIVLGVGATRLTQFNRGDLTSSETLYIRLTEWKSYLVRYGEMSLADQIVGSGLVEKGGLGRVKHLANEGPTLLDNTYLALLVNTGLMGLALVVGLFASAWRVFSRKVAEGASTLMVATAATFATLPFLANYEVTLNEVGVLLLLANLLAS